MAHAIGISGSGESISYELSAGEHLQPQTITAAVDGSGAASAFVVQVTIRNQDGDILTRTRSDDVVTAGDSGEVTFAPFVRAASEAGDPFLVNAALYTTAPSVIPSGVVTDIPWDVSSLGPSSIRDLYYRTASSGGRIHLFTETVLPYILSFVGEWESFAGTRYLELAQAAAHPPTMREYGTATPNDDIQVVTALMTPNAFDLEITFKAFQNSGVNRNLTPYFTSYVGAGGLF